MNISQRIAALTADLVVRATGPDCQSLGSRGAIIRPTDGPEIKDITCRFARRRARNNADRQRHIAILDMETDPFDDETRANIYPFLAVLYSDQFEPVIIWEQNYDLFVLHVLSAIEALPERYTIYAHNGGKFDYLFLIHKLRGAVKFKGRGLMSAQIGNHQLRDSFHIIPERLANWKKDDFDYAMLTKDNREQHRQRIIEYCINDCKYLLQIVRRFVSDNGMALSIGQASLKKLKAEYAFDTIGEHTDGLIRGVNTNPGDRDGYNKTNGEGYFFGGRVEAIAGAGRFTGRYKLYDVNSMYPYVMAYYSHPIGASYSIGKQIGPNTCFIHLSCHNFAGALISKDENGETTGNKEHGEFRTTIHEYTTASSLGLLRDVTIHSVLDCDKFGNFERFVLPIYAERQQGKARMADAIRQGRNQGEAWDNLKLNDIFLKLYLNNAYGKFAQNPRRYLENMITGDTRNPDHKLWAEHFLHFDENDPSQNFVIWQSKGPQWNEENQSYNAMPYKFYNIGTGASITGAARSVLLQALYSADEPIYCDTDSIICRSLGSDTMLSNSNLGAWKLEKELDDVIIVGKKQYAARLAGTKVNRATGLPTRPQDCIVRNKGVANVTFLEMLNLLGGSKITKTSRAPTLTKTGSQFYMTRTVRRTAPLNPSLFGEYKHAKAIQR